MEKRGEEKRVEERMKSRDGNMGRDKCKLNRISEERERERQEGRGLRKRGGKE